MELGMPHSFIRKYLKFKCSVHKVTIVLSQNQKVANTMKPCCVQRVLTEFFNEVIN